LIFGESSADWLYGGDGADKIYGGDAGDIIQGNEGNDSLYGEEGNDAIQGGDGDDFIDGGEGDDNLKGKAGDDTLVGGAGNDQLDGGYGNDILTDTEGDLNKFIDWDGGDVITAGSGEDWFILRGPTTNGPVVVKELTMNDAFIFKNECLKNNRRNVDSQIAPQFGFESTSTSLGGPWEASINAEWTEAMVCLGDTCISWTLKACP